MCLRVDLGQGWTRVARRVEVKVGLWDSCLFHWRFALALRTSGQNIAGLVIMVVGTDRSARVSPHHNDLQEQELVVRSDGKVQKRRLSVRLSVWSKLKFTIEKKMRPLKINVKRYLETKWCLSIFRSVARAFIRSRRLNESKASAARRFPFIMAPVS
jgi:hypothetical protein